MIDGTLNVDRLITLLSYGVAMQLVTLVLVTWLVIRGK